MRETTAPPSVRLDLVEFDRLTSLRGWTNDAKRASALGITTATMSRIRNGVDNPGARFIHLALTALDVPYSDLFSMDEAA